MKVTCKGCGGKVKLDKKIGCWHSSCLAAYKAGADQAWKRLNDLYVSFGFPESSRLQEVQTLAEIQFELNGLDAEYVEPGWLANWQRWDKTGD